MKKSILTLSFVWMAAVMMLAQPINKATFATMVRTAEEKLEEKDYYNAVEWYQKAYDEQKDYDIAIKIADLSYMLRDYKKSARYYGNALKRDKKNKYTESRFNYARSLKMMEKPDEAIKEFERYIKEGTNDMWKELAKNEISGAEFAKIAPEPENLTITNAGKNVNSKLSEYSPVLSTDGQTMYFASLIEDEVVILDGKADGNTSVKVFSSSRSDKGWGDPTELDEQVNRPDFHNGNVALSPDGDRMFVTRQTLQGNEVGSAVIAVCNKSGSGYGPANELVGVNGDWAAMHPAVGELFGKEVLFFVSNMDGGEGGWDLYYATHKGDNVYGDPVNLGPKINTIGDDVTPFYRDGTLYFSSDGHPTMGGKDIFSTTWDGAIWSEPSNMGKGYNTHLDEQFFMLDAEGYTGLMASNRPGTRSAKSKTCCDDIYYINLKKIVADLIVTAFDQKTKEPLSGVTLQLVEMVDNTPGKTDSKSNTGGNNFDFPLELDKPYWIIATAENYEPDTIQFNTVGLLDNKTFNEMVNLTPKPVEIEIVTETPIELGNVLYKFDSDVILEESFSDLQFLLDLMNEYPTMTIDLFAHTDARGKDAYNLGLSQRRAEAARRWLVSRNIARRRIVAKGMGETQPRKITDKINARYAFLNVGDVLTEEYINALQGEEIQEIAHQLNRRTEFAITGGPRSIKLTEKRLIQIGNKKVNEGVNKAPEKNNMPAPRTSATSMEPQGAKQDPPTVHKLSSLYGKKDLRGLPLMVFNFREIDFGTIKQGEKREITYQFTNEGDTPLVIDLVSACDCTTVTAPEGKAFAPGESGEIHIVFDSKDKTEAEEIDIDILLRNTEPDTGNPIIEMLRYTFDIAK